LRFDVDGQSDERVGRGVLRWKRDDRLTLEVFGEAAFNVAETSTTALNDGAPKALPAPHLIADERRGESGVVLNWKPNPTLSLDLALKAEASTLSVSGDAAKEREYAYAKPRLALSWSPDKATQVRLRLEHEVGQVGLFSLVTISEISGQTRVGNPDLRPGRAFVAEAAAQRRFGVGGDASLTLRRSLLRDATDVAAFPSDAGLFQIFTNIGDGQRTDFIASATVPLKPLGLIGAMLKGGFTLSDIQVTDPTDGRERPLSGQPQRIADMHYAQDFPQWRLNWGIDAQYRGRSTLYRPFGNETVTPWPRFAVFIERRFDPGFVLRVELQNLPGPNITQTIDYYSGLRDRAPLNYRDEKRLSNGVILFARLRRTFE
jgi:outer membrane receptor protein involved in Fe transport